MKLRIFVTLKPGVLDPQGRAIQHALAGLGFAGVHDVRAGKLLELVTTDAARALGMADRIGSLEPGKLADVITVDLRKPHLFPPNMPVWRLACFANGQDVDTVIVGGRVLMRGRQVLHVDVAEILDSAASETDAMLDRSGLRPLLAEPASIWGSARH